MVREMDAVMQLERNNRSRQWLLVSVVVVMWAVLAGQGVHAQEPAEPGAVRIQQMRVQVMPEFDDPRVLVMVQGRVEAYEQQYPVWITFRVPVGAQINQMATVNMASSGATMEEYEVVADPEHARWELVSYELGGAHFFYEYYYDAIVGELEKGFTYVLNSYHAVGEATVEIQEPKGAEGFRTEPEAGSSRVDATLRLTYHQIELGGLRAGEERSVGVNYTKAGSEPSLSWEQVMALQAGNRPPEVEVGEREAEAFAIPMEIVVFVGGALLVLVGVFVGYRLRQGEVGEGEVEAYCRMCGMGLKAGASYCHQCGARAEEGTQNMGKAEPATAWPGRERR